MTGDRLGIAQALAGAREAGVDRIDAQRMLGSLTGQSRSWLVAHADHTLDASQESAWHAMLARRQGGEPLAYVLGTAEFHGLLLRVDPNVLIPRADTEVLVDWAIELLDGALAHHDRPALVDLGTGSGAIALAVKHARPRVDMLATDVSGPALSVARDNAARLALALDFAVGPWWAPLTARRFDLVLSNPPYIAAGDPHLPALGHEPGLALSPGGDGLDALRAIVSQAGAHLHPDGWLLLEHGHDQAEAVHGLLALHGFEAIDTRRDWGGQPRCTGGRLSPSTGV